MPPFGATIPGEQLAPIAFGQIAAHWRAMSAPSMLWSEAEEFSARLEDRIPWQAEARLLDGRLDHLPLCAPVGWCHPCGFQPRHGRGAAPRPCRNSPRHLTDLLAAIGRGGKTVPMSAHRSTRNHSSSSQMKMPRRPWGGAGWSASGRAIASFSKVRSGPENPILPAPLSVRALAGWKMSPHPHSPLSKPIRRTMLKSGMPISIACPTRMRFWNLASTMPSPARSALSNGQIGSGGHLPPDALRIRLAAQGDGRMAHLSGGRPDLRMPLTRSSHD